MNRQPPQILVHPKRTKKEKAANIEMVKGRGRKRGFDMSSVNMHFVHNFQGFFGFGIFQTRSFLMTIMRNNLQQPWIRS